MASASVMFHVCIAETQIKRLQLGWPKCLQSNLKHCSHEAQTASAAVMVAGHIGFLGRAGVFMFVAILMFRTIKSPNINSSDVTTIGNALSQLQRTHGGRAGLFILGFFLLVYGTFAVSHFLGLHCILAAAVLP